MTDAEGDETQTLGLLWDYCVGHPDEKVIYMHSKGSFNSNPKNDVLQRFVTRGAASEECANLPDSCNLCASRVLKFQVICGWHDVVMS